MGGEAEERSSVVAEHMKKLIELAQNRRVVELAYRKHLSSGEAVPRLVEPYNFTQGQQDVILRCYQLEPDQGWRFFMVHKIDEIRDGGEPFQPRVTVTLDEADLDPSKRPQGSGVWSDRVKRYRDLVSDAMADETVTKDELEEIRGYVKDSGLTEEERKFVHASLFHRCLGAVIEDGEVSTSEVAQIQFLHRVLKALGWGVIE